LAHFSGFGIMYREKSSNPGDQIEQIFGTMTVGKTPFGTQLRSLQSPT
jgi:hypothetical protein